jgi:hypothetical protein
MSGPVKKKVAVVDKRSPEEIAIQSAMNSNYNVITPLLNGEYAYINNPLTQKTAHLGTNSDEFFEMFLELCEKGLMDKLRSEVVSFSKDPSDKWAQVLLNIDERLLTKTP